MLKLIQSEWRLLLFGFLMTFWSSPGQTFFIALFSGEIRAELNLSDGQFGAVYSLATLLSALAMILSGTLLDRIDLKKFALATVLGLAAGCILMSMSAGIVGLFVGLFALRQMGQGLMTVTSSTAVVRYLDTNKGKSNALAGMGYAVSEALMPSLIVALILWLGWRQSWVVTAVILMLFMIPAISYLLRRHHQRHVQYLHQLTQDDRNKKQLDKRRQWTRAEVVRDKYFYLFIPGLMSQPLMFTGFIFHQIHLVESRGWSLTTWASLFFMYALISVATKIITGFWVDRAGAIRLLPLIGLPMSLGLLILATTSGIVWGGVFLALTGVTVGIQSTITAPFFTEMYGSKHLGSIKSLATAVMVFCTGISPVLFGWLIDIGMQIEILALASAMFMLSTSVLAYYAYRLR
ncbi:MAG: MFS transporter [Gammaproteobacteria bacterium]|nr:MFS transporter [Gammaproteobacteria bacterium]